MKKMERGADFGRQLRELCQKLLRADPDFQEIIQFGSSVYALDLALDLDLLVTTAAKKDDDVCQDAEGEFRRWRERVGRFIEALEREGDSENGSCFRSASSVGQGCPSYG